MGKNRYQRLVRSWRRNSRDLPTYDDYIETLTTTGYRLPPVRKTQPNPNNHPLAPTNTQRVKPTETIDHIGISISTYQWLVDTFGKKSNSKQHTGGGYEPQSY